MSIKLEFQGCKLRKRRGTARADGATAPRSTFPMPRAPPALHGAGHRQPKGTGSGAVDSQPELTLRRDLTPEGQTDPEQHRDVTSVSCVPDARETHAPARVSILSCGARHWQWCWTALGSSPGPCSHAAHGLPKHRAAQPLTPPRATAGRAKHPQSHHGP